jgi:hypothetical protein
MPALTRESFDSPVETRNFDPPSSGHLDLVAGGKVGRAVFNPGWRWSANVKPIAGTELCEQAHGGYFLMSVSESAIRQTRGVVAAGG